MSLVNILLLKHLIFHQMILLFDSLTVLAKTFLVVLQLSMKHVLTMERLWQNRTGWSSLWRRVSANKLYQSFSLQSSIFLYGMSHIFVYNVTGHFCPALSKAVKTMKKGEKVTLTVKPQCKLSVKHIGKWLYNTFFLIKDFMRNLEIHASIFVL
jgi:TusA-related sulfurtransferase